MNKQELIAAIAKKTGLSKADSQKALEAFTDTVSKELRKKGKVKLIGFGTFETQKRAARISFNPQTGKALKTPASAIPAFRPGKALMDLVIPENKITYKINGHTILLNQSIANEYSNVVCPINEVYLAAMVHAFGKGKRCTDTILSRKIELDMAKELNEYR